MTKKKADTDAVVEEPPVADESPAVVDPPATTLPAESVDLQEAADGEESMTINDFVSVVAEDGAFAVKFITFDDGESMMRVGFPDLAGAEAFAEKCVQKLKQDVAALKTQH